MINGLHEGFMPVKSVVVCLRLFLVAVAIVLLAPAAPPTFAAGAAKAAIARNAVPAEPVAARKKRGGAVYLLRGFGDVFSRGLDDIGQRLEAKGVDATVKSHGSWQSVTRAIIADRKQNGARPVVLIGHSLGANAVILIAEELGREGISVQYMVTFAATEPSPVPRNVKRVTNYYFGTNGWGKPLVGAPGFRGKLENKDFSHVSGVGHFNIDEQREIQDTVFRAVLGYVRG